MYPVYPYFGHERSCKDIPVAFPPQHQDQQPGLEYLMNPRPIFDYEGYRGSGKLEGKVAIVSGGDSGIGRAVSVAFAKEGAAVAIVYLYEQEDAAETKKYIEQIGGHCLAIEGDLREPHFNREVVTKVIRSFCRLDILVNNAGVQFPQASILDISEVQLENTFKTNIFSYFYMTKAALPYMKLGSAIINTASITAYQGQPDLIDYSSTKGAVVSFTRSLSLSLESKGIRVNAVAPGPIWTPLIVSSFSTEKVGKFGLDTPMKRAGQPFELAPAYVYLASGDSRYVSGQTIHVNGGVIVES